MTQLAAIGVDPQLRPKMDSNADILTEALLNISYNQSAKETFIRTILGLAPGKPIDKIPIESSREDLIVFFAEAMERFVFAHEYGHVIKKHVSDPMLLPTGPTGYLEHKVLGRTWPQELEADAIGLRLLIQILKARAADNPKLRFYYIYALKAPLFLFECMELLERTQYMVINDSLPPVPSDEDKAKIRTCADSDLPDVDKICTADLLRSHPPAWLRKERLAKAINERLGQLSNQPMTDEASQKGYEMIFSLDLFWRETSHQLLEQIVKLNKTD